MKSFCTIALLTSVIALVGCKDKKQAKPQPSVLRVHAEAEPAHLLSMLRPDAWAHRITAHNVLEALVRLNPKTYKVEGELASTWKVSPDGKKYTFYLRQGVKWHDGGPFTGKDVVFTFDKLLDEQVRAGNIRATLEPFLKSYKLVKPDQFEIDCKEVSPWFLINLADIFILPAHLMSKGDFNHHPLLQKPVGTGPYRIGSWKKGRSLSLKVFADYWGVKPQIKEIIYYFMENSDLAIKLARRGELDFLSRIRASHFANLVQKEPFFRHEFITTRYTPPQIMYILLNHRRPLFKDVRVRRALAMLLDLDKVVSQYFSGLAKRVGALYWSEDPDYNSAIKPIPFNPKRARQLLAEAGYKDSDGNGVLDKNGEPFRFVFLLVNSSTTHRKWLTMYQQELKKSGIIMEISPLEWAVYLDRIRKHDFDAGALGMVLASPYTDLYYQFHSSQIEDGQNYGAYQNKAVDTLLEKIRTTLSPKKRHPLSLKLQERLAEDVAAIPLFSLIDPGLVARKVHGVYTSALWYQLRDWWIE